MVQRRTPCVLLLKGLVYGLPREKIMEAFNAAAEIIRENGITTVAWDGDKLLHPKADGLLSFTSVIPLLMAEFPYLKLVFFKKIGDAEPFDKAEELFDGNVRAPDRFGNELGPYESLTRANTTLLNGDLWSAPASPSRHLGVVFSVDEWYDLGLKGLQYIKRVLGVDEVHIVIVGSNGGGVKNECEKVREAQMAGLVIFPTGYDQAVEVEFDRPK
jgi:hypothetical protein